jgi:hypothetical protein
MARSGCVFQRKPTSDSTQLTESKSLGGTGDAERRKEEHRETNL